MVLEVAHFIHTLSGHVLVQARCFLAERTGIARTQWFGLVYGVSTECLQTVAHLSSNSRLVYSST